MVTNGRKRLQIVANGRKLLQMVANGRKLSQVVANCRKLSQMVANVTNVASSKYHYCRKSRECRKEKLKKYFQTSLLLLVTVVLVTCMFA